MKSLLLNAIIPFIVGGVPAVKGELPFQVSLHDSSGHFCGGSLIKPDWVLTAAHCVDDWKENNQIFIGMVDQTDRSETEVFTAKKVIPHSEYNGTSTDYDFALIQLSGNSTARTIALNTQEIEIPHLDSQDRIVVWTAGWGDLGNGQFPNVLQKVDVPLVNAADCNAPASYDGAITDRMICAGYAAGGKDSCQADSGGPLFATDGSADGGFKLVGVVSWGDGCASPDKFGVYSKVNVVMDWVNSHAQ